jgi:Transposase DDE domain
MFVRVVKGSSKKYVLIVRSFRDKEGKPRQETVWNLGPVNDLNQEATVNLAKRMIAHLEGQQIIVDATDIQEIMRQNWGAPAVMEELWNRFSMNKVIADGPKSDAIKLMMLDRLISPSSKLSTYNKRNKYVGFEELDINQLYRSIDYLANNSDAIKSHIYQKQRLRSACDIVFFDVTTLYFESQKADLLRDFGYSKDCKFNEVQIVLCLLIDSSGKPLSYELFPGNTFEGSTLIPSLKRLYDQFSINKLVIVADRGIGSKANLKAIKDAGYEYIVGAKLRSANKTLLAEAISEEGYLPMHSSSDEDWQKYKFLKNGDQDWVVLYSSKRAQKDKIDRERLVEKAEHLLQSKSLSDKRGAKKFIKQSKQDIDTLSLDEEKIEYDSKFDGYYAISFSDKNLSAETISGAYHGLWMIEEKFRTLKSFFEVRPMFHWTKKRIEGHILMNFLLLVMENYLIDACEQVTVNDISHNILRKAINDMEVSTLKIDNCAFASYAPINDEQNIILKAMNINNPKNHKI